MIARALPLLLVALAGAARAQQPRASVLVVTDPPGAWILLDDRPTGRKTPYLFEDLPPGPVTIECVLDGLSARAVFDLLPGQEAEARFELPKTRTGALLVVTEPADAQVLLDDEPAGRSPATLSDVRAGLHRVRVRKEGWYEDERRVEVFAGALAEVRLRLDERRPWRPLAVGVGAFTPGEMTAGGASVGLVRELNRQFGWEITLAGLLGDRSGAGLSARLHWTPLRWRAPGGSSDAVLSLHAGAGAWWLGDPAATLGAGVAVQLRWVRLSLGAERVVAGAGPSWFLLPQAGVQLAF